MGQPPDGTLLSLPYRWQLRCRDPCPVAPRSFGHRPACQRFPKPFSSCSINTSLTAHTCAVAASLPLPPVLHSQEHIALLSGP